MIMGNGAYVFLLAFALVAGWTPNARAADERVSSIQTLSPTYTSVPVVFGKGGRVGNWLSGSGNVAVMDANISVPHVTFSYLTNIFTLPTNTSTPALTLISKTGSGGWQGGAVSTNIPATGAYYVGNPWFCPGTPSGAYMLFQAQNLHSLVGQFGQPGGGYDNDIWVYRPANGSAPPKVWQLTTYGISGTTALGPAVIGPQCSQDSSSSLNMLHIVYGRLIPGAPSSTCNSGNGPSDGNCWWFGQWELVYGDVYFNASGDPATDPSCTVSSPCNEPGLKQTTINHVNPRNAAANPFPLTSGTATLTGTTLSSIAVTSGGPLMDAMVGGGMSLSTSSGPAYALITCYNGYSGDYTGTCSTGNFTISSSPSGFTGHFTISNFALFEPHWYVSNGGNIYLTSNRRPPYHDAVGVLDNFTNQSFQELTAASPPYVTGGVTNPNKFANTFWDEFLTPDITFTHSIFMSDRATGSAANLGIDPEYSDHYMCSGLNCSNVVRLTYFDDTGMDATLPNCAPTNNCFPITAVRGAWSPDSTQYLTLVEYIARADHYGLPAAALYLYTFQYPNTEVSGYSTLSGLVHVGR